MREAEENARKEAQEQELREREEAERAAQEQAQRTAFFQRVFIGSGVSILVVGLLFWGIYEKKKRGEIDDSF